MRALIVVLPLACVSCSRYGEFTLPSPGKPATGAVTLEWERRPEPVLPRSQPGSFDSVDTLNPSVVQQGGQLWNFYSGYDGSAWHTALAESADGLTWKRSGRLFSPARSTWEGSYIAANGSALYRSGKWLAWYQGGSPTPRIGMATSTDGRRWTKHPEPVIGPGPRGS
ncbi:MAG TPA: hypothetical protein VES20_09245, partial [Bryobacteraceae bacterium]|nr:hypothetical protein [Bryobacteraceae bacterium]